MTEEKCNTEPEWDSIREFADAFRVSNSSVRRGIHKGDIRAIRVVGSWRIPRSERERIKRGEALPQI